MSTDMNTNTYLSDVLLLCAQCQQPIKARINTPYWLRVDWIGPEGECLKCYQEAKRTGETDEQT